MTSLAHTAGDDARVRRSRETERLKARADWLLWVDSQRGRSEASERRKRPSDLEA